MKNLLFVLISICIIHPAFAQTGREDLLQSLEQGQGQQPSQYQQAATTATTKSAVRLFGAKDDLTTVIMIIPSGSKVKILDSDSTYFLVNFEETEGYILKRQATVDAPTERNNTRVENTTIEAPPVEESHPAGEKNVSRFTYLENKYGTSMAARINAGKIWKGMNAEMVRDSWGNPLKINRVISGNNIKEEWSFKSSWLYFENNTLVQWGPVRDGNR